VNRVAGVIRVKHPMTPEQKRALAARVRHVAIAMRERPPAPPARIVASSQTLAPKATSANGSAHASSGGSGPEGYPGL
jgi:hypothetical protein